MEFYYPGKKFPSLSVTGERCDRMCKHCRGRYLRGMVDVDTPKKLMDFAVELDEEGGKGFLLSGGSDDEGRVPLYDHYDILKVVKQKTELLVNVHTGLADEDMANNLKRSNVDVISYDVIASTETLKEIYQLDKTVQDVKDSYDILISAGLEVVPHITVGLYHGEVKGEYDALEMVKDSEKIVVNSLIPSELECTVPQEDILDFIKRAKETTDAEIILGCMRERGNSQTEIKAMELGIDGIVLPSKEAKLWAEERYDIKVREECCAV